MLWNYGVMKRRQLRLVRETGKRTTLLLPRIHSEDNTYERKLVRATHATMSTMTPGMDATQVGAAGEQSDEKEVYSRLFNVELIYTTLTMEGRALRPT